MQGFLATLLGIALLNALLAYSQYAALRAGVFSVATAGFAAIGAYAAAILVSQHAWPGWAAVGAGVVLAASVAALLAAPLARLRGVFQAIASLAFVQVVLSVTQNWSDLTGGAMGLNGIPRFAGLPAILLAAAAVVLLLHRLGHTRLGREWDLVREDETAAVALGVRVARVQFAALVLSGALGGLAGALEAGHNHSITPGEFGFAMLVNALAFVVLGGRVRVAGPLVGAAVLTLLPELFRAFADWRLLVTGLVLMGAIAFVPEGIVDTLADRLAARRLAQGGVDAAPLAAPAPAASAGRAT